jgi:DNA primase
MSNGKDWIDFNTVKQSVSMEMLIIHFGLFAVKRKGDEVRLKCPFHNGKSDNSMTINLATDSFYCFGCKRGGGVINFVASYEDCSPRMAALKLDEWFKILTNKVTATATTTTTIGREVIEKPSANGSAMTAPPITAGHLIASIEHQLAQLKRLILSG